jgi:hypothetical protein
MMSNRAALLIFYRAKVKIYIILRINLDSVLSKLCYQVIILLDFKGFFKSPNYSFKMGVVLVI